MEICKVSIRLYNNDMEVNVNVFCFLSIFEVLIYSCKFVIWKDASANIIIIIIYH